MRISRPFLGVSLIALALQPVAASAQDSTKAPPPAPTTTLRDALVEAYKSNPDLTGERATLRATDENVPIARSSGLPSASATAGITQYVYNTDQSLLTPSRTGSVGATVSVPVYSGGSVRNAVRAAVTRVDSGRASLRATESDVFTQVVGAYLDVIRDEAIVRLNQQNVHALDVNLQATRDRFEVGDLTRTDVAQSESRLALAQSQLSSAEARLIGSRENYIRVVGSPPGILAPPPPLPAVPADAAAAVDVALANNPNLEVAQKSRDASKYDVKVADAARLPKVSVGVGPSYYNYLGSLDPSAAAFGLAGSGFSATASVNVSMPLYQGGRPAAQVRQAQARESAAIEQVTSTERGVISQARSAFASCQATLKVIDSSKVAVEASRLSLEGVRAENSVGTRTILDILNAEQEFLNSQVDYVTAEHDSYVSCFSLLAAMGKTQAKDLGLDGGPLYDPVSNYNRIVHKIGDWGSDPEPRPVGTRTNQTPAQTPEVKGSLDPLLDRPVDSTGKNP